MSCTCPLRLVKQVGWELGGQAKLPNQTIDDKDDPCQESMKNLTVNMISESEYFPKAHGVHSAYWNMVQMLRQKGVKVLINSRQKADITHIHTVGPFAWYKLLTCRPSVVSAHLVPESFTGSLIGANYWRSRSADYLRFFYNRADLVLAVSPQVKIDLEGMGIKKPIEVMPNVIDTHLFRPDRKLRAAARRKLGFKTGDFVALSVGQIQPRKGLATFLKTAAQTQEVRFLWVGSRPFKKLTATEKETDQLLAHIPKNFKLFDAGKLPYEEMPGFYDAADMFFFPSYQENFGMVVVEAAAVGLPLLLRNLPVYKIFGDAYIPFDDGEPVDKIERLRTDSNFYSEWAKKATILASKFSFDALGDRLIKYYQGLIDS